jgi:membrane AbrB-like protein
LSWWGIIPGGQVPGLLLGATYAAIGLMVGLDLSRDAMRRIAKLLPLAGAMLFISIGLCAALGVALGRLMGVSAFSSYLAFTPGGLPAVTAVAVGAGAEAEFVVSCQIVRLLLALLTAAVIGAMMRRPPRSGAGRRQRPRRRRRGRSPRTIGTSSQISATEQPGT